MMRVDMRIHENIREQVRAGLLALIVQTRQTMVPVPASRWTSEFKRELGYRLLDVLHFIDSTGIDVLECLDAAFEHMQSQRKSEP